MRSIKIAPSILAADLANLGKAVTEVTNGGADQVHLDIIDGHFAPNITFGPGTVKALRALSDLPFDTHLMIDDPLKYCSKFIEAGSDILTFHSEVLSERKFDELYSIINKRCKIGIALKPETQLPRWVYYRIDKVDVILIMTVNPGFSGQALESSVLPKINTIYSKLKNYDIDIEVDGGIDSKNVGELVKRGANVIVSGAGIFMHNDISKAIKELRERAMEAVIVA